MTLKKANKASWLACHRGVNVLFSLSFFLHLAFCPYHIGHFSVVGLGFEEYVRKIQNPHPRHILCCTVSLYLCCSTTTFHFCSGPSLPLWGLDHNHSGLRTAGHDTHPLSRILHESPLPHWNVKVQTESLRLQSHIYSGWVCAGVAL